MRKRWQCPGGETVVRVPSAGGCWRGRGGGTGWAEEAALPSRLGQDTSWTPALEPGWPGGFPSWASSVQYSTADAASAGDGQVN